MRSIKFSFLFLIVAAFTYPAKEITLEYKFKKGDAYEWTQATTQKVKQTLPGIGEMVIDMNVDGAMSLKVLEVTATGAKVEMSFPKIKMVTKSVMADIVLDSEGPQDNTPNKIAKAMTINSFTVYLTKFGTVEKLEGTENLYSGFSGLGLDEAALAGFKEGMKQFLSESAIKSNIEMALLQYPTDKVKVGDTWKSSVGSVMNLPASVDNTWKFSGLEGSVASIDGEGIITTTDKEKVVTLNGLKAKADLAGRQVTKFTLDVKTGWPSGLKLLSEVKGKMTFLAGGPIPEDMDVPMEITTESTFTVVKK